MTNADETPGPDAPEVDESARSVNACPRCGAHRLALLGLPEIDVTEYHPLDEAIGMGVAPSLEAPAIGCLSCGAEWADLAAFEAERASS
jgi:hypothetical protein